MKLHFIPACVMLVAGLITCILCMVQKWPVGTSLMVLAIVLVVFYIIGQIAAQIVGKVEASHQAMVEAEKKRLEEERIRKEKELAEQREAENAENAQTAEGTAE